MDFVDEEWGMDLAEPEDEVLLARLRSLLGVTAPMCENCNQEVTGMGQLEAHRAGSGHVGTVAARRRYAEVGADGRLPEGRWCNLCGLCCNDDAYDDHLRGSRHRAAYQVRLKLWALRFAIGRICEELHRRNVPVSELPVQARSAAAACPVCPEESDSQDGAGESKEGPAVPGSAGQAAPAGEVVGGEANASEAAAGATPMASGPLRGRGAPGRAGGSLRQEIMSVRAEVSNVMNVLGGLSSAVTSMARNVGFMEASLRDLRHEVEGRNALVGEIAERVRAVERMVEVSRGWQQDAEAAIKSISEDLGCGESHRSGDRV